jgi:hypothetical protein
LGPNLCTVNVLLQLLDIDDGAERHLRRAAAAVAAIAAAIGRWWRPLHGGQQVTIEQSRVS